LPRKMPRPPTKHALIMWVFLLWVWIEGRGAVAPVEGGGGGGGGARVLLEALPLAARRSGLGNVELTHLA